MGGATRRRKQLELDCHCHCHCPCPCCVLRYLLHTLFRKLRSWQGQSVPLPPSPFFLPSPSRLASPPPCLLLRGFPVHRGRLVHHHNTAVALASSATPGRRPRVPHLASSPPSRSFSPPLFFASFSPVRISGHILCSFSQVSHAFTLTLRIASPVRTMLRLTDRQLWSHYQPPAHCKKFDIYDLVSSFHRRTLPFTFTVLAQDRP